MITGNPHTRLRVDLDVGMTRLDLISCLIGHLTLNVTFISIVSNAHLGDKSLIALF